MDKAILERTFAVGFGKLGNQGRNLDKQYRVTCRIAWRPIATVKCVLPTPGWPQQHYHLGSKQIEAQYGKAERTWVMDRGIPTEGVLAEMRASDTPICYLVGTPRGRLGKMERPFLDQPWVQIRDSVQCKLVDQDGELYILARSDAQRDKEQAMRRRQLKKLVKGLHALRQQKLSRDRLLIKLGAAKKEAGPAVWRIVDIRLPEKDQPATPETFGVRLNWQKLRETRRHEGSYLLRSNMTGTDSAVLWQFYLQLVEVEQAFKDLKDDLAIECAMADLRRHVLCIDDDATPRA